MNIEEFIHIIEKRPQMYVFPVRIDYIYFFLSGYLGAIKRNVPGDINYTFFLRFSEWLLYWIRNNINASYEQKEALWYHMLLDVSASEDEAVKLFFKLSKEFFNQYHRRELD